MIVDLLRLDLRFELLLNLEQVIARALSFEGTATGMYFGEPTVPRSLFSSRFRPMRRLWFRETDAHCFRTVPAQIRRSPSPAGRAGSVRR
jgi:hypothetical protein